MQNSGATHPHPFNKEHNTWPGMRRAGPGASVTSPASSPLHHPHGIISAPASLQSCRARERHHVAPMKHRGSRHAVDQQGSGYAASPVPAKPGALPGAPPCPLPVGVGPLPSRAHVRCAPIRAYTLPRASVVGGCLQHRPSIFPHTPTQAAATGRRPAPAGWTTGRRAVCPWPCHEAKEKKKRKNGGGWGCGWWWRALVSVPDCAQAGVPSPWSRAARTTGSVPPAPRPYLFMKIKKGCCFPSWS
jgi:hypothetical protein